MPKELPKGQVQFPILICHVEWGLSGKHACSDLSDQTGAVFRSHSLGHLAMHLGLQAIITSPCPGHVPASPGSSWAARYPTADGPDRPLTAQNTQLKPFPDLT